MPDSSIKRAARWLGFIEDDKWDYDDADHEEVTTEVYSDDVVEYEPSTITSLQDRRPVTHSTGATAAAPRQVSTTPAVAPQPQSAGAEPQRVVTVHPRTYNEARTIGEHFRDGVPVIMNLSEMEDSDAKRLVDFAAGLIFGLRGRIERVTNKVFLLSPQNVEVSTEDKERIASGSFFNQS